MKKQVLLSYHKAINNSPSDFLASDGELADCVNFEVKNQELKPVEMPVKLPFTLDTGEELLYVHNVSTTQKSYIVRYSSNLKIFTIKDGVKEYLLETPTLPDIKSINAIGNVVVVYTDEGPYYIKYQDGEYKYIGNKFIPFKFEVKLGGMFYKSGLFDISFPSDSEGSDAWHASVTNQLLGRINKEIADMAGDNGRFVFPFFLRYAFRLFDGSYVFHSAPILLLPNTKVAPLTIVGNTGYGLTNRTLQAQLGAFMSWISVKRYGGWAHASNWDDIITSIDFFVSSPIYLYDQNAKRVTCIPSLNNGLHNYSKFVGEYEEHNSIHSLLGTFLANTDINVSGLNTYHSYMYFERPEAEIYKEVLSSSNFYKFASISYKDACNNSFFILNETDENVTMYAKGQMGVEVNETLPDDYMTNDTLVPESVFVYNKRLNITNIKRKPFSGLELQGLAPLITDEPAVLIPVTFGKFEVYVNIKSSSGAKDIVVHSGESKEGALFGAYLFYPDSDAYKMTLIDREQKIYCKFDLTEHPYLNGSYVFMGYDSTPNFLSYENESDIINEGESEEVMPNKLFTSELNNPFLFPLEGIYTVGTGGIIGMAAITRAISQGQFGQYPLLLFCSDGNYALSVDEKGYYSSISPIQEDVILGSDKIASLEDSIAVITKKGIMIANGGEMTQIAANMDGKVFDKSTLSGVKTNIEGFSYLVNKSSDEEGFLAYLSGARMAYDYSSNRLFIYNSEKSYMYLYNFENGTTVKVVMPKEQIVTSVLDYPDTIIQSNNGNLYSLYQKVDVNTLNENVYSFAVTRPMNLGDATVLKSVMQIKNLITKSDKDSYVKYIMYGSNDNINFFRISSRFGKPYKFYRFAIYGYLKPKDSLSGTVLTIDTRRTNKLR